MSQSFAQRIRALFRHVCGSEAVSLAHSGTAPLNWLDQIRVNAERQLPALLESAPHLPPGERKRILFWCMSPWSYTVVDCILATALRLRGHEVVMIVCDGLPFCEAEQLGAPPRDHQTCCAGISAHVSAFGLPSRRLSEFIGAGVPDEAERVCAALDPEGLRGLVVDGVDVGNLALVNTGYYQGLPATLWARLDKDRYRVVCRTGYILVKTAGRILDDIRPDTIVTVGGRSVIWAPIYDLARQRGLGTVNWEDWSVDPHGFRFDHEMPAVRGYLREVWNHHQDDPLTEVQREQLGKLFAAWKRGDATPYRYYDNPLESPEKIQEQLGLNGCSRTIAMYPNILREDNVIRGAAAFDNQIEWLSAVMRCARRHSDMGFVVRLHPAEVKLPRVYIMNSLKSVLLDVNPQCPVNVRFVEPDSPISSYALADLADVLMVWTGTLGLEFAMAGRQVLVAGQPGYAGKGFTVDLQDEAVLDDSLNLVTGARYLTAQQVSLAERYAYLSRFRTLVRFPFLDGHASRTFAIPKFCELGSGGNAVIEDICTCITEGKPFVDIGGAEANGAQDA